MLPFFSIIIPTYNRAHLIAETLASVAQQTHADFECLIIDDGSTDETLDAVSPFLEDPRFTFHKRPHQYLNGGNGARNYGYSLAKGAYIKWLDSDDLLNANLLEEEYKIFAQHPETDLLMSAWEGFRDGKIIRTDDAVVKENPQKGLDVLNALGRLKTYNIPPCYTVARSVIINAGLWNPFVRINQDAEFFSRILLNSMHLRTLNFVGVGYRMEEEGTVSKKHTNDWLQKRIETWKLIESYLENTGVVNSPYVETQKRVFYKNFLRLANLEMIKENKEFFKNYFTYSSYFKALIKKTFRNQ